MTDFEHGSVPMLILVDESGTSFIVMNSPSTFEGPRFSGYEAQKNEVISAPILRRCCTPLNQEENHAEECFIKNEDDHREDDDREIDTREDEAVLEEAIFNRKSQLEKQAEERAEGVFRLWYKENKSLEQAIDESLRDHVDMLEKAHALRLQFNHEKSLWMSKIRQDADDNRRDAAAKRETQGYTRQSRKEYIKDEPEQETESKMEISSSSNSNRNGDFIYDLSDDIIEESEGIDRNENKKRTQPLSFGEDNEVVSKKMKKFLTPSRASTGSNDIADAVNVSITSVPAPSPKNIEVTHANVSITSVPPPLHKNIDISNYSEVTSGSNDAITNTADASIPCVPAPSQENRGTTSHLDPSDEIIVASSDSHACSLTDNSLRKEIKGENEDQILDIKHFLPDIKDVNESSITNKCNINLSDTLDGEDVNPPKESYVHESVADCMDIVSDNIALDVASTSIILNSDIDNTVSSSAECLIANVHVCPPSLLCKDETFGTNEDAADIIMKFSPSPPQCLVTGRRSDDVTTSNVLTVSQPNTIANFAMINGDLHPSSLSGNFVHDNTIDYMRNKDILAPIEHQTQEESQIKLQNIHENQQSHQQSLLDSDTYNSINSTTIDANTTNLSNTLNTTKEDELRLIEFIATCVNISDSTHLSTSNEVNNTAETVQENAIEISTSINRFSGDTTISCPVDSDEISVPQCAFPYAQPSLLLLCNTPHNITHKSAQYWCD